MDLKKNNLVTELPCFAKEFDISFDLFVTSISADAWQSVIHFTTGSDCCAVGTRIPGIWINHAKKCMVWMDGTPKMIYHCPEDMELNKWIKFDISQRLWNDKVSGQV